MPVFLQNHKKKRLPITNRHNDLIISLFAVAELNYSFNGTFTGYKF